MHGCSNARTKSMAISIVSTKAVALASARGPGPEQDEPMFIMLSEKSWGRLQPDMFT